LTDRPLLVRAAAPADAPAIAAIYNEGIADRIATFETRERTTEEVRGWLDGGLPFLVATVNDGVVGFARVAPYSDRCVYAGVGEHGVYVARAARGHGVGRRLLDELCLAA
jgi:L-amino acid N-acyltransferase YncA